MLSEQWKAIPMSRRVMYFTLGGAGTLGLLHWVFYVLLRTTGLFDVAAKWGTKTFVINGFPFSMLLLSMILAALVLLGALGYLLWPQTPSLKLAAAVIAVVLAVYLAGLGMTPHNLVYSIKQTAAWYHKL